METKPVDPVSVATVSSASAGPWDLQATQADHGETSVVCDSEGNIVCLIPARVWNEQGCARNPRAAANARLIEAVPTMLNALRSAERALEVMAEAHEQETRLYEAGGWATEALLKVRQTLHAATQGGPATCFLVSVPVVLKATGISAYDEEAARRYVRDSLGEVREHLDGSEVDLGFADGNRREATLNLPESLEIETTLEAGEEGDPEGTMAQAEFSVEVAATVDFVVEVTGDATQQGILAQAQALLAQAQPGKDEPFDDACIGAVLSLATPGKPSLAL